MISSASPGLETAATAAQMDGCGRVGESGRLPRAGEPEQWERVPGREWRPWAKGGVCGVGRVPCADHWRIGRLPTLALGRSSAEDAIAGRLWARQPPAAARPPPAQPLPLLAVTADAHPAPAPRPQASADPTSAPVVAIATPATPRMPAPLTLSPIPNPAAAGALSLPTR
mmetsp:Transcript_10215/g.33674  ORF Transcript_10215/g.33674 Transcript_10215/m.33674 type:complete len:170 (-) Transcript_10215:432-941(-)|eukprot:scaffold13938_cov109-Isochrysis_galbana.AAC.3